MQNLNIRRAPRRTNRGFTLVEVQIGRAHV